MAIQSWLRPALTHVGANKDFAVFREQLDSVETLLRGSHLESMAMDFSMEGFEQAGVRQQRSRRQFALKALRVETLRMLLGNPAFRPFSRTVASSEPPRRSLTITVRSRRRLAPRARRVIASPFPTTIPEPIADAIAENTPFFLRRSAWYGRRHEISWAQ